MKRTALPPQPTTTFPSNLLPGKATAILSLLLPWLILPSIGAAQPFADDFNDGNDNGWTRYDPLGGVAGVPFVHYSFPGGAYRIQADASPNPAYGPGRGASLRVSTTYTDFYEAADVVAWNPSLTQAFGLLARVTSPGLGSTLGYAFTYQEVDHNISIAKITGEDGRDISGTSKPVTLDPAKSYRFVFIGKGANLEGRVYELPDTRHAIATTSTTESSYPNGISGLLVYDNSSTKNSTADATFDNLLALDIEPPELTLAVSTFGDLVISWTSDTAAFQLQYASTVPSTNWITIPSGEIFTQGNQSSYTTVFQPMNTFFRLLRP